MATWSGRGQGACPNCSATYSSRWKPSNCSKCGFELGGSAPVSKAQKMCCPSAVNICGGLHSIRTSSRDDRCLVYSENNLWICLHPDCKDVRAAYVSSDRAVDFTCQHIKQVSDSVGVLDKYNLTAAKIAAYPCDTLTKALLDNISIPLAREAVYKVSDRSYVVYGPPSATNTLGVCYVKVEKAKKVGTAFHKCSCKGFVAKAKQEKSRALCVHLHVLFCALELYTHVDPEPSSASATLACPTSIMSTTSVEAPSSSRQLPSNSPTASPEAPSVSRLSTLKLYSTFKLPYHFSSEYLNNVGVKDASTLLGGDNGWPSVFEVKEVACEVCGEPLETSKLHSGMRGGSILYTNQNPFKDVVVKVKECTSTECRAMHRVCPTEEGIFIVFLKF